MDDNIEYTIVDLVHSGEDDEEMNIIVRNQVYRCKLHLRRSK